MGYNDRCAALADCDEVRISGLWGCLCMWWSQPLIAWTSAYCYCSRLCRIYRMVHLLYRKKSVCEEYVFLISLCACEHIRVWLCMCVIVFVTVKIMILLFSVLLLLQRTKSITMTNPESSCVSCVHAHRHVHRTVKNQLSLLEAALLIVVLLKLLSGVCNSF